MPRLIVYIHNVLNEIGNSGLRPQFFPDPSLNEYKEIKRGNDAWIGVMPDYEINPKGMVIADVFKNSPANKANLKAGDIISKLNGKDIKDYYDLESALSLIKPGDSVQLLVVKDNAEKTISIKAEKYRR